ncbi:hypothetical protein CK203_030414 [Vitis vinifera]|uniref:Reverse transcriptase zinc-binding domain-containing protein n=1 Tax=Vitis vinifera TaxID=29760 RepID=A0A438IV88_VITVI|nr:hypothetical protein CK203_030414 [Vitis vinifera]
MVWGFFVFVFPSLFALTVDKEESVADVWDSLAEGGWGGWNPCFLRAFNDWEIEEASSFMEQLHRSRVIEVVRTGYHGLKLRVPKISFFVWEATWGKALTLDKIACVEHFSSEPLSFMLKALFVEENSQVANYVIRNNTEERTGENLAHDLSELKRLQKCWSTTVLLNEEPNRRSTPTH